MYDVTLPTEQMCIWLVYVLRASLTKEEMFHGNVSYVQHHNMLNTDLPVIGETDHTMYLHI